MVLCKFFQQGTCRFGSKCVNEHLDVKQMVKTDIEAAINGKQWPLSTYGPFRDKPSIPNFIEDQSFEEVRMLCYEAKQKNFFEQFHQQFTKEALEASNKMNALLQMTPDIVDVLVKVYNVPSDTSNNGVSSGKTVSATNNPFGLSNSAASNAGSIFAKSSASTPANSMFTNNNNAFAAPSQGTALFTNASAFAPQQQQQQTSIFAQASKPANSIFASGNNTFTQPNTSIFAQHQNQSSIFASSAQQQQSTSTGLFSQQTYFPQQPQQNSNIFRQVNQSQPQQGLFAQGSQTIQQQHVQPQQGLFAQAANQTSNGPSLFAQPAQQNQNIFSQAIQQQQQTSSNIFQQNVPNSAPQQAQNTNIFLSSQPTTNTPQQVQSLQPSSGLFQQAPLQTQNTVAQPNQFTQVNSTLYSRLEDLTADEIEAFKSDCFLPGKIPFNPPPRELIN